MEFWVSLLVSLFLLLAAIGLTVMHVRTWRSFRGLELEPDESSYRWRQFRRRMQSSGMLGLLAVAIFVGQWIESPPFAPLVVLLFWAGTLVLVVWLALLAMADIVSTKHYFSQVHRDCLVEQAKLKAEIHRIKSFRGNGKASHKEKE